MNTERPTPRLMTDAEIACQLETSLAQAQKRIAELETDLERTRNERNRAGMDARKDMLDKIQAHPEPLALLRDELALAEAKIEADRVARDVLIRRGVEMEQELARLKAEPNNDLRKTILLRDYSEIIDHLQRCQDAEDEKLGDMGHNYFEQAITAIKDLESLVIDLTTHQTHPEPLPRPDGPDVFLSQYFQALRMNPKHTLGLGDIRLTYGQQEELVYRNCAPKKEGES